MTSDLVAFIRALADDPELINVARRKIEDVLIEFRDRCISVLAGNGFVCREADGRDSSTIRLSTRDGVRIALRAIADHVEARQETAAGD